MTDRFRALSFKAFARSSYWDRMEPTLRQEVATVSRVLPFRVNSYLLQELIDWQRVPDDPIFQLTFPQRTMLAPAEFQRIDQLVAGGASDEEIKQVARQIRAGLNPHPGGQLSHNVPMLGGKRVEGVQHKYRETVLYFPQHGQTCHAYCTYCFRWAQFVGDPDLRFASRQSEGLVRYLEVHPEVTDVLVTGGDPLIMKTQVLRKYIEPLLSPHLAHLRNIRIGTKAVGYWPQRFVTDDDADDLLRLFEEVRASGRSLALMAHYSHPVELKPDIAQQAVARILGTGSQIRMQTPLVRHVNDEAQAWVDLWRTGVQLGMFPYYMFVERDTGPRSYFEVPLIRAWSLFQEAYSQVSGLARSVRGPSMSAFPGKVRVLGVSQIHGEQVFVLDMLQARRPHWVRKPFFAKYDPKACWLDQLKPALGESRFFWEEEEPESSPATLAELFPIAR